MLPVLSALQAQRWFIRQPCKLALFAGVVFTTLYPSPGLLRRHIEHVRATGQLTDPGDPAVASVHEEFIAYARRYALDLSQPDAQMRAVERFVYERIPYAWDWDTWGVADYLPTVAEVLDKGREDCDGRAVLAAALLRSQGVAARLVADPRHVWVRTSFGDLMNPMGPPVFEAAAGKINVRWRALLDPAPLAFGVAVFPLVRELIILLAAWLLLLPPRTNRLTAAIVLLLLTESLVLVRLAGVNPGAPSYAGIVWAAAHWPATLWVLLRYGRPCPGAAEKSI